MYTMAPNRYNGQATDSRLEGAVKQIEYSFHSPTSERLSGDMVLMRLRVKDERELRLQGDDESILTVRRPVTQ